MANVFLMPRPSFAVTFIATGLVALTTGAIAQAAPPNLPAAIMCYAQADQSWKVGYLSRVNKRGEALYVAADRRLSLSVTANGVVAEPTNRPAG